MRASPRTSLLAGFLVFKAIGRLVPHRERDRPCPLRGYRQAGARAVAMPGFGARHLADIGTELRAWRRAFGPRLQLRKVKNANPFSPLVMVKSCSKVNEARSRQLAKMAEGPWHLSSIFPLFTALVAQQRRERHGTGAAGCWLSSSVRRLRRLRSSAKRVVSSRMTATMAATFLSGV